MDVLRCSAQQSKSERPVEEEYQHGVTLHENHNVRGEIWHASDDIDIYLSIKPFPLKRYVHMHSSGILNVYIIIEQRAKAWRCAVARVPNGAKLPSSRSTSYHSRQYKLNKPLKYMAEFWKEYSHSIPEFLSSPTDHRIYIILIFHRFF
jgi:hypothetical protein